MHNKAPKASDTTRNAISATNTNKEKTLVELTEGGNAEQLKGRGSTEGGEGQLKCLGCRRISRVVFGLLSGWSLEGVASSRNR